MPYVLSITLIVVFMVIWGIAMYDLIKSINEFIRKDEEDD